MHLHTQKSYVDTHICTHTYRCKEVHAYAYIQPNKLQIDSKYPVMRAVIGLVIYCLPIHFAKRQHSN